MQISRRGERGVWQRRYWEHLIRDDKDFAVHMDYAHVNPLKHGLVKRGDDWLALLDFSSLGRAGRLSHGLGKWI